MDKKKKPFEVTASSVRCSEREPSRCFFLYLNGSQLMSEAIALASRVPVTEAKLLCDEQKMNI